ncbi:hypothetical protein BCAR13_1700012 [Paraburkholderia caribensis]|nr:hypothetical protein BCAR13_1700012 [Paraburkholderia caribensis]
MRVRYPCAASAARRAYKACLRRRAVRRVARDTPVQRDRAGRRDAARARDRQPASGRLLEVWERQLCAWRLESAEHAESRDPGSNRTDDMFGAMDGRTDRTHLKNRSGARCQTMHNFDMR